MAETPGTVKWDGKRFVRWWRGRWQPIVGEALPDGDPVFENPKVQGIVKMHEEEADALSRIAAILDHDVSPEARLGNIRSVLIEIGFSE